jgi:hypothetical protein
MIKLDWLGMKYYQIRIIVIPIAICFMGIIGEILIVPFISFFMLSFSVNPFAVEKKGKLDNLYLTLPVTSKTIVNARLGLSLIMQFAGLVFGTAVTAVMAKLLYGRTVLIFEHDFLPGFGNVFLLICLSLLFYAVMHLSMFPVLFKLGYAKGKAIGFYVPVIGVIVLIYAAALLTVFNESFKTWGLAVVGWAVANMTLTSLLMLAAAVLIYAVSYALSQRTYSRREF